MIDNPLIRIYVNQIEILITFRIKTGHYLILLTPEAMKLLESTNSKITKDENDENVSHLEITEVAFIYFNIVRNDHQQDSRVLHTFVHIPINCLVTYKMFHPKFLFFKKPFILWILFINWSMIYWSNSKPLEIKDKVTITLVIN